MTLTSSKHTGTTMNHPIGFPHFAQFDLGTEFGYPTPVITVEVLARGSKAETYSVCLPEGYNASTVEIVFGITISPDGKVVLTVSSNCLTVS